MKYFEVKLNNIYSYLSEFPCSLCCYIADPYQANPDGKRRAMMILPGGGYHQISEREAEPIAFKFLSMGYNAFILKYSPQKFYNVYYPTQLLQSLSGVRYIKENSEELHVDNSFVGIIGFSAGGHLCGLTGLKYNDRDLLNIMQCGIDLKPRVMGLCYAVSCSGEFASIGSMRNIANNDEELVEKLSLNKLVTEDSPPVFIWHTAEDKIVHSMNSLLVAQEYARRNLSYELHIFKKGPHAMSLATELSNDAGKPELVDEKTAVWMQLLETFLNRV